MTAVTFYEICELLDKFDSLIRSGDDGLTAIGRMRLLGVRGGPDPLLNRS